jgi:hypothetical protein
MRNLQDRLIEVWIRAVFDAIAGVPSARKPAQENSVDRVRAALIDLRREDTLALTSRILREAT